MKQTPNVRPRACARTEEWSNLQPGRPHDVSGLSSAVTSGHPSETPSSFIPRTRSGRVPNVASTSGERAIVRRHGPLRRAALRNVDLRPSVDNEREKTPVKIVESSHRQEVLVRRLSPPVEALAALGAEYSRRHHRMGEERRAAGAGLPQAVVKSYASSEACSCPASDCFFFSFKKFRFEDNRQTCIPCGTHKSSQWRTGGERARQHQLYFTGRG